MASLRFTDVPILPNRDADRVRPGFRRHCAEAADAVFDLLARSSEVRVVIRRHSLDESSGIDWDVFVEDRESLGRVEAALPEGFDCKISDALFEMPDVAYWFRVARRVSLRPVPHRRRLTGGEPTDQSDQEVRARIPGGLGSSGPSGNSRTCVPVAAELRRDRGALAQQHNAGEQGVWERLNLLDAIMIHNGVVILSLRPVAPARMIADGMIAQRCVEAIEDTAIWRRREVRDTFLRYGDGGEALAGLNLIVGAATESGANAVAHHVATVLGNPSAFELEHVEDAEEIRRDLYNDVAQSNEGEADVQRIIGGFELNRELTREQFEFLSGMRHLSRRADLRNLLIPPYGPDGDVPGFAGSRALSSLDPTPPEGTRIMLAEEGENRLLRGVPAKRFCHGVAITRETGNISGYDLAHRDYANRPLPAVTDELQNAAMHGVIFGGTGTGKTTYFENIVAQFMSAGIKTAVIEPVRPQLHKKSELKFKYRYVTNPSALAGGDERCIEIAGDIFRPGLGVPLIKHISLVHMVLISCMPMDRTLAGYLFKVLLDYYIDDPKACGLPRDATGGAHLQKWRNGDPTVPENVFPGMFSFIRYFLKVALKRRVKGMEGTRAAEWTNFFEPQLGNLRKRALGRMAELAHQIYVNDLEHYRQHHGVDSYLEIPGETLKLARYARLPLMFDDDCLIELDGVALDDLASVMCAILIALMGRREHEFASSPLEKLPLQHLMLIDEAHNIAPANMSQNRGEDAGKDTAVMMVELVTKFLSESRAAGQAFWLADQNQDQMAELRNAHTRVLLYSDSPKTRATVTETMGGRKVDEQYAKWLMPGQAIIRTPTMRQPRLVALLPPNVQYHQE